MGGGELGFAWQDLAGEPVLVVGGRQGGPPDLFFVFPADPVEAALAQLRAGLLAGGAVAIGIALLVAWVIARWLLRPVAEAGRAARRIAGGDLVRPGPGAGPRRGGPVGRGVQPDGGLARGDDRAPRGLAAAEPAVRGRRRPRAADAADRARRGGLAARAGSGQHAAGGPPSGGAAGHRRAPPADARGRPHGDLPVRRRRRAARHGAGRPRPRGDRRRGGAPARGRRLAPADAAGGGLGPAPPGPDPGQPPGQRAGSCSRAPRWRSRSRRPATVR